MNTSSAISIGDGKSAVFGPLRMARGPQDTQPPNQPTHRTVWAVVTKKGGITIIKLNRSLAEQVFGIGHYRYSKDGQLYFVHGKTRIKVTEHFPSTGKPMKLLLEDLIQFSVKQQDNEVRPVC